MPGYDLTLHSSSILISCAAQIRHTSFFGLRRLFTCHTKCGPSPSLIAINFMTYLSVLDDSQSEMIGGGWGLGDTTSIIGISLTSLTQSYNVQQYNTAVNNVVSAPAFLASPLVAASITNSLSNIALIG
jgi:hypothetical protein